MDRLPAALHWQLGTPTPLAISERMAHVRYCSPFAAAMLDRYPQWAEDLSHPDTPSATDLAGLIDERGLDSALRFHRNRSMLGIIWRDLCGLASLDQTFADLGTLATTCLQAALDHHHQLLADKHGQPGNAAGQAQKLAVVALGKFGGGELNLSSDIDILFCYDSAGECLPQNGQAAARPLSSDQFFTRQARAVIASLAEIQAEGFCFRVDTRLRPFGDSGPLCSSLAAMEQYYQREGRDWERYAWIKARPVAGDLQLGQRLMQQVRPFVYRRYIDFSAVEALQEMHLNVLDDARRSERLDDIKRGPGGIREIEFLVQCFQLLRGGRETSLQTPSLLAALTAVKELELINADAVQQVHQDYGFLRQLENRIQALHDQQTHQVPQGEDLQRLASAMRLDSASDLQERLAVVRHSVNQRFEAIFPSRPEPQADPQWARYWRQLQDQQESTDSAKPDEKEAQVPDSQPLSLFLANLQRLALSQRSRRRLDLFMPVLLSRLERLELDRATQIRIYDLVASICRRSAYLVLLVQNPAALDRLIELFARSEWIADRVIRFPALLDELIDPSLGQQIPQADDLRQSVARMLDSAPDTESALENLNYLKLASTLRIAVAQLGGTISGQTVQATLASLAAAILQGSLQLAGRELELRHGRIITSTDGSGAAQSDTADSNSLVVIAYGSLGSKEPGYESDLDLVFLFDGEDPASDGERSLGADRYYARLAQRMLGLLTAMTPSGKLYEVDTRLRPNGRAGSLVSSLAAFRDYQQQQAWTWELQALTRACPVAGHSRTGRRFEAIRRDALSQPRELKTLRTELANMRARMAREKGSTLSPGQLAKHGPGGLVDIEFVAQLGVLASAADFPQVLDSSATSQQLQALAEIGWLDPGEASQLALTAARLHELRLLVALVPSDPLAAVDTTESARICQHYLPPASTSPDDEQI